MRKQSNRYIASQITRHIQYCYDKILSVYSQIPMDWNNKKTPVEQRDEFLSRLGKEDMQYKASRHTFAAMCSCAGASDTEIKRYLDNLLILFCGKKVSYHDKKFMIRFEKLYLIEAPYEISLLEENYEYDSEVG